MAPLISWALLLHTICPRWPSSLCCLKQRWLPWRQCEQLLHSNTIQNGCYFFLLKSQDGASYLMGIVFAYYMSKMAVFSLLFKQRWLPWRQCEQLLHSNTIVMVAISFLLKSQYGACYLMGIVFTMWHSFLCWANNDSCHSVNVIIFGIWRYFNGYVSFAILIWLPWRPSICSWLLIIFNMPSVSLLCKFNMAAVMSCDFCVTTNGCRACVTVHAFTLIACSLVLTTFLTC